MKRLSVVLLLLIISVSNISCVKSGNSGKTSPPDQLQYGKAGEKPTAVFTDYDWVIMSKDYLFEEVIGR